MRAVSRLAPWSGIVLFALCLPAQQNSRLFRIDSAKQAFLSGQSSLEDLSAAILQDSYDSDFGQLPESHLSAAEQSYLSAPDSYPLTDFDVAAAFDAWRLLVKDPDTRPTSPLEVHKFRMWLTALAPSLVSKDKQGAPSLHLAPTEAVFLLDFLIGHGSVPVTARNGVKANSSTYATAYQAYVDNTPDSQRAEDLQEIVDSHIFKVSE
jgi:hypothetical protein